METYGERSSELQKHWKIPIDILTVTRRILLMDTGFGKSG